MTREIKYFELNYYTYDGATHYSDGPSGARVITIMKSEDKTKIEEFCKWYNIVVNDISKSSEYNLPYEKYFIEEIQIIEETEMFDKKAFQEAEKLLQASKNKEKKETASDSNWPFNIF